MSFSEQTDVEVKTASASINSAGYKLLYNLASKETARNVFFSPLGICTALSIVYGGAVGETAKEFQEVMGFQPVATQSLSYRTILNRLQTQSGECDIKIANSLWYDRKIQNQISDSFIDQAVESYSTSLYPSNFDDPNTVGLVNSWVQNATQGKINSIVDSTQGASSIIANAVYFAGEWLMKFDPAQSRMDKFHTVDGDSIDCMMMSKLSFFEYFGDSTCQIIFIPYETGISGNLKLSLCICLPRPDSNLSTAMSKLENLDSVMQRVSQPTIDLKLPRFCIDYQIDLVQALSQLGLRHVFNETMAELENFAPKFFIEKLLHKARLEVNEQGTVAAAATAAQAASGGWQQEIVEMHINAPFILSILDRANNLPLFVGCITNPEKLA